MDIKVLRGYVSVDLFAGKDESKSWVGKKVCKRGEKATIEDEAYAKRLIEKGSAEEVKPATLKTTAKTTKKVAKKEPIEGELQG